MNEKTKTFFKTNIRRKRTWAILIIVLLVASYFIFKTPSSEVILTVSDSGEHECISFVNGICTKMGGVHVDTWSEVLFRPIIDKLNTKKDKPQINIKEVKQFFRVIINCVLPNPELP